MSTSANDLRRMDREATEFALALLIPADLLIRELAGVAWDIEDERPLKRLAQRFRVSPLVMMWRIAQLNARDWR